MLRLSIIVPFYNVEPYIEQCIRSLFDQDIPLDEYEVICVDDCSPDGSRAIVERLQVEYSNLHLIIHERNKKLGGARNTGLRAAKGEYVWFVDSDDYVMPNVMGMLLKTAVENKVDMLQFSFVEDYDGEIKHYATYHDYESGVMRGKDMFFYPDGKWWINHVIVWQKLFRREYLLKHNLFFVENIMFEDNEYAFRTFMYAERIKHIALEAYVYRNNPISVARGGMNIRHLEYFLRNCVSLMNNMKEIKRVGGPKFVAEAQIYIRNMVYKVTNYKQNLTRKQMGGVIRSLGIRNLLRLRMYITHRAWWNLVK